MGIRCPASGLLRSFQDTDGNGAGDLRGIFRRLTHLADLGIGALRLSPIFPSPMDDFGYDICDHTGIDPLFGTLEDFDALIAAPHGQGLKVLLDLVPNHTSDRHPWFIESQNSRDNPKRDWYIWADGCGEGEPPNNWLSEFGGSSWEFDAAYRALIGLRRTKPQLALGDYEPVKASGDLLAYMRKHQGQLTLIILNFERKPASFDASNWLGHILLSTYMDRQNELVSGSVRLRASDGLMVELSEGEL